MLYNFNNDSVIITEDVGGREYEILTQTKGEVYNAKYMRVELEDYNIIKAILRSKK